ncbi:LysR family transcriptional regulator [Enterobacter sp. BIGb0383]|uniref:LysR family transcriptional regulator n=1 Tax=unclassified Enterobacter TaxID=2608935 RepID=UPI000F489EF5|nr:MULTISPECIES: LysR family transcriptional regulator [unclassified Enterobacter]ROP62106.1 LysR family transcriptional regulator [Enterobacter sp. BIGb0383]ROS12268.1 LysR family transcriptional regulator [Enterobacter sp. BIGb0359]
MQINVYELMRIFIEIVETGSFSQASENLQIHRPAVTKALQQLELHCGVRLLHRTTRRINLTPEGEEFYRSSKPLLEQTDDLLGSFSAGRSLSGQLRIDMPVSLATLLVVPNLPDFYRAYPGIEVVLSSSDRRKDMLRDGLDCIVRVGALEDGDYVARSLGNVKLITCASPAYLAEHGVPETLDDLQHHQGVNWFNVNSRQIMPWVFQTPSGIEEIHLPGKLVLDNSEVYIVAGLTGLGLLQGMDFFLRPYINDGRLVEVLPGNPVPARRLSVLYPHRHISPKVRVFTQWLETLLEGVR